MVLFERFEWATIRVSRLVALLGLFGLLILALAIVLDVLLRWIFNSPITGVRDASIVFISVIIASCFALCKAERNHITIRFLGNALGSRVRDAFEAFGHLVTWIVFTAMTWQYWLYSNDMASDGETTMVLGWPLSPWWRVVTILFGISVIVQFVVFVRAVKSAISRKNGAEEHTPSENQVRGNE